MSAIYAFRALTNTALAAAMILFVACSDTAETPEPDADAAQDVAGDFVFNPDPDVTDVEEPEAEPPPPCPDGEVGDDEECDDGNEVDDDACANDCTLNDENLCFPCEDDDDCSGDGLCLEIGGAFFCGFDCSESDDYCLEDFTCSDVTTESGTARQCLPTGGYCECPDGFEPSGNTCIDIDECAADPNPCGAGDCTNAEPGYTCSCHAGYQPDADGLTCVDVDECVTDADVCGSGVCSNFEAGYACDCPFPYVQSGGTCVICPAETALTLTMPAADACVPLAEADHEALLDRATDNLRRIALAAIESVGFVEISPVFREALRLLSNADCPRDEPGCVEPIAWGTAVDFVNQWVDRIRDEGLILEHIESSDACSLTVRLPDSLLCQDEPDCVSERFPVRIVMWWAAQGDVYAELLLGQGTDSTQPVDLRVFADQVAIIADLKEVARAAHAYFRAGIENPPETCVATPEDNCGDGFHCVAAACVRIPCTTDDNCGDGYSCGAGGVCELDFFGPDPADMEGIVEVVVSEEIRGDFKAALNVRRAGLESAHPGVHVEWTFERMFDHYTNETPLPLIVDLAEACPLAYVDADDTNNVVALGTAIQPVELLVPFAYVSDGGNPLCEGAECCGAESGCDCELEEDGCCTPMVTCCYNEYDILDNTLCPCYDDNGMPGKCCGESPCQPLIPVQCPYDDDGNQFDCLPTVGSAQIDAPGLSFRLRLSAGDDDEDKLILDRFGLGDGPWSVGRDGDVSPLGTFVPVATLDHIGTLELATSSAWVSFAEHTTGVIVEFDSGWDLQGTTAVQNILDRLPEAPTELEDEVAQILFAGTDPVLRISIWNGVIRPLEVISGTLTIYSQYLEDTEDPPRVPPGTITVDAGMCLIQSELGGEHPLDYVEPGPCPVAAPAVADAMVDADTPDANYADWSEMTVSPKQALLLTFDLSNLPDTITSAHLELYLDEQPRAAEPGVEPIAVTGEFSIYEIKEAWTEGTVTWNVFDALDLATTRTAFLDAEKLMEDTGFRRFDITGLVNAWLATPASNFGVALVHEGTSPQGQVVFLSREHDDEALWPRLVIVK